MAIVVILSLFLFFSSSSSDYRPPLSLSQEWKQKVAEQEVVVDDFEQQIKTLRAAIDQDQKEIALMCQQLSLERARVEEERKVGGLL